MGKGRLMILGAVLVWNTLSFPIFFAHGQPALPLRLSSPSAVLMDRDTGRVLFSKSPAMRYAPASLAKVMTLYLAFDAIQRGDARSEDVVLVSKKAWKMGGSQMFLKVGDRVPLECLIRGAAAVSANDGALAIAEFLAGSETAFVRRMNEKARDLGMKDTHFVNPHGLPRRGQYTTALDMAKLGFHYIHHHPECLRFHSLESYEYRGIRQWNRNRLLNQGLGVDGLKTGYIRSAGYHILVSAKKDGKGFIGVVMGADTARLRNRDAAAILRYGMRNTTRSGPSQKNKRRSTRIRTEP